MRAVRTLHVRSTRRVRRVSWAFGGVVRHAGRRTGEVKGVSCSLQCTAMKLVTVVAAEGSDVIDEICRCNMQR